MQQEPNMGTTEKWWKGTHLLYHASFLVKKSLAHHFAIKEKGYVLWGDETSAPLTVNATLVVALVSLLHDANLCK